MPYDMAQHTLSNGGRRPMAAGIFLYYVTEEAKKKLRAGLINYTSVRYCVKQVTPNQWRDGGDYNTV